MIPDFSIDIRIRLAELKFFMLLPVFANFLPCWLAQFCWDSQQGRELAKSGSNKRKFQFCQSYFYVNRKVWYNQILIPNNLGFMVLILMWVLAWISRLCTVRSKTGFCSMTTNTILRRNTQHSQKLASSREEKILT